MINKKGFTLIEILIVLTIVVLLAAASYPIYSNFYRLSSVEAAKNEVVQNLRIAREYATSSKNNSSAGIYFFGHEYTIFSGGSYLSRDQNYDMNFSINDNMVFGGDLEVVFQKINGQVSEEKDVQIINTVTSNQVTVEILTSGVIQ